MIYFSFIIPVYNVEEYVETCVESILKQNFSDFEIILVNDGSSDSSGEICEFYSKKDVRIKVIHKKNGGVSNARNIGIENAKGEYLIFLDSDDYWQNEKLGQIYDECKNGELDILAFNFSKFDNLNVEKKIITKGNDFKEISREILNGQRFLEFVMENCNEYEWYPWIYVIKRTLIIDNKLYFKKDIKYEDVELMYKIILLAERVKLLNEIVVMYRVNRLGAITNGVNIYTELDKIEVVKKNILNLLELEVNSELKKKLCNNFSRLYYSSLILLHSLEKNDEKEILRRKLIENLWICEYSTDSLRKNIYKLIKLIGLSKVCRLLYLRKLLKGKRC